MGGGRESLFSVVDGAQEGEKQKIKRKRWFLEWGGVIDLSRCDSSESSHGRKKKKKRFLWPCSDAKLSVTHRRSTVTPDWLSC